ncbi:zinc finger protein 62-like isoform X1 [Scylla paramamosain]|uniref:zinc finger protein 62-like isoform X1 n=1 Tax=Scylla paramamosain TaxID=85552 RepID=UPI003082C538
MGTIKPLVSETLHLIAEFIQEVRHAPRLRHALPPGQGGADQAEGAELVNGHSLTYQLSEGEASCSISAYILSLEKLISNLKTIVLNLKSKTASPSISNAHQSEVSSDNDSSEESQESPGEGGEISGSQMSTTPQYALPAADIKASLDKHPALDTIVEDAGNTTSMVLPPNSITSIPSSSTLQESLIPASFPATFTSEHQPPQIRNMADPTLILDGPVNVDQSYTDATRNQEDLGQFPSCIKCGESLSSEGEATSSGGNGVLDTCSQCSSIADSVSKRRRRKTMQDDTPGLDSCGVDSKAFESSSKKHSCEKCGRVFSKWKHLSIHCTKVHMDEDGGEAGNSELMSSNTLPLYCCKTCNLACLSVNSFNTHNCRLPTDDDNPASTLSNRILITNVLKLHKLRKFVCEVCGVEYRTFKRITYHLPRCSPGPYPCNVCTLMFATQKELNYHKRKMHKDEKCFVCDECGKSFQRRTSLQKHAINWHESSSAVGPFKCDLCPKKFIRRIYLTNHKLRMHGLDKKFLCQVCGNKFMTQNSLMTHMEVHSDQKKFECSFCKKKFKRKEKLKYHERIHTGERPYQCQLCSRGFVSKTKLDDHVSRHLGDRRYRCSFCTKTYAGAYDLKQHIRKVHDKPCDKVAVTVVAPSQTNTSSNNLTQVQVLDPLAIATAASGLKEEEVVTCGSSTSSLPQPQGSTSLPTLEEVGGGMVGGGQYITMSGQQTVTIPVVGSVQGHIPSIGHVVQVSGSTVPLTGVGTALGTGGTSVQTVQAVQTIPGVTTTEYSVQTLPPQAVHAPQGYIFTQGFDMVSGTLQY